MELKIIFPGEPRVKKNNMTKHEVWYDKKNSVWRIYQKNNRITPVTYYTKAYQEWAREAIQTAIIFKSKHHEFVYPLDGRYNMRCLFISNENKKVDLSALYEGAQDILAGNAGILHDSVPGALYQIIMDDSVRFICSHNGSGYYYLPAEQPRTEVTLTEI